MAKVISELSEKTNIVGTDYIPMEDANATYKATVSNLSAKVKSEGKLKNMTADANGKITITQYDDTTLECTPHDSTKQDTLTFDSAPTDGSNNPVTSNGVYDAIAAETTRATTAEGTNATAAANALSVAQAAGTVAASAQADATSALTGLNDKVDKVNGKGLSTEDYTTVEKTKLSGIETGAEVNVQPDWNQTDAAADDYIKNKPDLTVDDELSPTSENPVQNKVVYEAIVNPEATILAMLDGTKTTYDKVMKRWFELKGAKNCTPAQLTALCEEWYSKTRDNWNGYTTFAQPSVTAISTGTAGGDNAGLTCTPSTNTTAGTDDYAGLPLFAIKDVNYEVDATTLDITITDIDGVTDGFERSNPNRYVGVMQMAGYRYQYSDAESYTHGYSARPINAMADIEPLPEAVRVDGTLRQFVVHGKYYTGINGTKMTQCSGQKVRAWISHNTLHTISNENGAQYSGGTTVDDSFLKLMTWIKYKSLTLDNIMAGCNNYNGQYYAQVSETDVKRVLVPTSAIIEVGSMVEIGTYGSSADRGTASNYNISGQYGAEVTAVETVTVSGTTYKAIYVDTDETFDTVANGNATSGSTIISTWHWKTGMTDSVLGNDGSWVSNTDSKHPFKLQGIECMVGGYEVLADVIMNIETIDSASHYVPYIVRLKSHQATSITANYEGITDLAIACPASDSWQYIKKQKYKGGVTYPEVVGGSSSTFTRDAFYMNKNGTVATREWLAFGCLYLGAYAGLSFLNGCGALTYGHWYFLARLSPNGNRGEWAA